MEDVFDENFFVVVPFVNLHHDVLVGAHTVVH